MLELQEFHLDHAPVIASWVSDPTELLWLAPRTAPPLSASKVIEWTAEPGPGSTGLGQGGRGFTLHSNADSDYRSGQMRSYTSLAGPCGYGEVNPMRHRSDQAWLGHVIIAPHWRGRGLGMRLGAMLLDNAFANGDIETIALIVFPQNAPAIRCYTKLGFAKTRYEYHRFDADKSIGRRSQRFRMLRMDLPREVWIAQRFHASLEPV